MCESVCGLSFLFRCFVCLYLQEYHSEASCLTSSYLILLLLFFFLIVLLVMWGLNFPHQGLNPNPLHCECGVLTSGPSRKSPYLPHSSLRVSCLFLTFACSYTFQNPFVKLYRNLIAIFIGSTLNLLISLKRMDILLSLSVHKCGIAIHLSRSSFSH